MKITNNSEALQGINTVSGVVYIRPGQTRELDVSEVEAALLRRHSFLAVEVEGTVERYLDPGDKEKIAALQDQVSAKDNEIAKLKAELEAAAANDEPSSERDELKKQAGELGITFAKNIPTDKLKALIDAKLAA